MLSLLCVQRVVRLSDSVVFSEQLHESRSFPLLFACPITHSPRSRVQPLGSREVAGGVHWKRNPFVA